LTHLQPVFLFKDSRGREKAYHLWFVRFASFLCILLIAAPLFAAENLLIVDVYARIVPEGQTGPIPDPFIQGIVSGAQQGLPAGIQQLQSKTFQVKSGSADFQAVVRGVEGQRVELSFTGTVLPNRSCAVTDFQIGAASESSRGNVLPSNSSQTMSRGGFTVAPGQRITQSLSVQFRGGLIFYYLIFSAAKGVVD
jgi:hypothetical protein